MGIDLAGLQYCEQQWMELSSFCFGRFLMWNYIFSLSGEDLVVVLHVCGRGCFFGKYCVANLYYEAFENKGAPAYPLTLSTLLIVETQRAVLHKQTKKIHVLTHLPHRFNICRCKHKSTKNWNFFSYLLLFELRLYAHHGILL